MISAANHVPLTPLSFLARARRAFQIADEALRPLPADGTGAGEILIRSNTVAAGCLDDEAATEQAFRGGWFHTGDLGVMHADGYIELTDRSKDIISAAGRTSPRSRWRRRSPPTLT
jgi:acyl-CoA synthetase (AMP-forming)/AMP-acid ligase II